VNVPALPFKLRWLSPPVSFEHGDEWLRIEAGPRTDWFADPSGERGAVATGPALVGHAERDYVLSAKVTANFAATFDAGVLMLHADERTWAKLCFELSPDRRPMVVSVVTRGVSDDCNSFAVDGDSVWLRIARLGPAFAFHASTDGQHRELVRHFSLGGSAEPEIGFEAQSPTGEGCSVTFDQIRFETRRLTDLRSGD
jgi:regulation of enolase protein 1 (concanavalin A-like superfamily)